MLIDFNNRESAGIKSFTVRKRDKIKVTTRFISGKLLMFAKLSLKSFIYDIAETFSFPDQTVIENVILNPILTAYSNSTALQFTFISDSNSDLPEDKFRDIIFEVIIATKIYKRFDTSHEFLDIFGFRKESRKKS